MGVFVTIRISLFKELEKASLAVFSVIYRLTGATLIPETKNTTSENLSLINSP